MTPGIWMSKLVNTIIGDLRVEKKAETDKLALIEYCMHQLHQDTVINGDYKEKYMIMFDKISKAKIIKPFNLDPSTEGVIVQDDTVDSNTIDQATLWVMQSLVSIFQSGIKIDVDRMKENLKFLYRFGIYQARQFYIDYPNVLSISELDLNHTIQEAQDHIKEGVALLLYGRKDVVPAAVYDKNMLKYNAKVRSSFGDAMKSTAAAKANSTTVGRKRSGSATTVMDPAKSNWKKKA